MNLPISKWSSSGNFRGKLWIIGTSNSILYTQPVFPMQICLFLCPSDQQLNMHVMAAEPCLLLHGKGTEGQKKRCFCWDRLFQQQQLQVLFRCWYFACWSRWQCKRKFWIVRLFTACMAIPCFTSAHLLPVGFTCCKMFLKISTCCGSTGSLRNP